MKTRLLYKLSIGMLRCCAYLPFCLLYLISDIIFVVVYYLVRYRRNVVQDNLLKSFPEKSESERRKIEVRFYRHLCDCIVETVKLLHFPTKEVNKRIEVVNAGLIDELAADGAPVVLYLGHYGNWEWTSAVTRHYRRPALSGQIYRPLRSHVMEQVMLTIRSCFHTVSIPQNLAFRSLIRMRQEGQQSLIGFVADQRPNSANLHHWVTFLNQDTAYSTGGEEIGKRTDAHFVYLEVEKTKRGHFRMTFHPIVPPSDDKDEYPYTRQFMKMLEATIRRAPEYWLWTHKRWRFSRSEIKYNPF